MKDNIPKGNGRAETEVTGAGWNGQPNSSSELLKLTNTHSDTLWQIYFVFSVS